MRWLLALAVVLVSACVTPAPNVYARFYHGELHPVLLCLNAGVPPPGKVAELKCGPPDVMIRLLDEAAPDAGAPDTSHSL